MVSQAGKEATITLLAAGDFIGEESIAGPLGLRMATATAITACVVLKIERDEMIRVMHEEHTFSNLFLKFLLARSDEDPGVISSTSSSTPAREASRPDFARQTWPSSLDAGGALEPLIPKITQETLDRDDRNDALPRQLLHESLPQARIYRLSNGRITVHKSLLNVILHDQLPEHNGGRPELTP